MGAGPQPRLQGQVQQEEGGSARGQHVGSSCRRGRSRATAAWPCLGVPSGALSLRRAPRAAQVKGARGVCGARRPGLPSGAVLASRGRAEPGALAGGWAAAAQLFMVWPAGARGGPRPGRPPWRGSPFAGKRGGGRSGERGRRRERPECGVGEPTRPSGTRAGRSRRPLTGEGLWESREAGAAIGTQDGVEMEEKKGAKRGRKCHCPAGVRHHQSPHLLYCFCFLKRTAFGEVF